MFDQPQSAMWVEVEVPMHSESPRRKTFKLSHQTVRLSDLPLGLEDVRVTTQLTYPNICQLNLFALALYRANYNGYADFGLATEVADVEKLDDIVFLCRKDGRKIVRYIQAKYVESESNAVIRISDLKSIYPKNDFSLLKYFKSYLEMKKCCNDFNSALFNFEIDEITIVTNKIFTSDLFEYFHCDATVTSTVHELLYIDNQDKYRTCTLKLGQLYDDLSTLFMKNTKVSQTDVDEFFKIFHLVIDYPSRSEIERILKEELCEDYNVLDSNAKLNVIQLELYHSLLKQTGSTQTYQSASELFGRIERKISGYEAYSISKSNFLCIPNEYIFQNDQLVERIVEFLSSDNVFILTFQFDTIGLARMRTVQALKKLTNEEHHSEQFKPYTHQFGHILINSEQLLNRDFLENLKPLLQGDENWNLIVIELDDIREGVYYSLISYLRKLHKKVILISKNGWEDSCPSEFQQTLQIETNFSDLETNSQAKLLKTENTIFQETSEYIGRLIGEHDKNLIDVIALDRFVYGRTVKIGIPFPNHTYIESYYIKRRLNLQISIRPSITKNFIRASFTENAFYLLNGRSLVNAKDVIVISNSKKDFEKTVENVQSKNFHWLKNVGDKLIWMQSKGSASQLVSYRKQDDIIEDESLRIDEEALLQKGKKIIIISGEYGAGKSTFFESLAKKFKDSNDICWTIRLDLLDYCSFLTKKSEQQTTQPSVSITDQEMSAINSLIELLRTNEQLSIFEECLLRAYLQRKENNPDDANRPKVVLFIDQFSEIDLNLRNFILNMLVGLKSTDIYQIVISTRRSTRSILEVALGSFAFEILAFSETDQFEFFEKRSLNKEALNAFNKRHGFHGTPLCLEIISIIDADRLKTLGENCLIDLFEMSHTPPVDIQEFYERIFQEYFSDSKSAGKNFDFNKLKTEVSSFLISSRYMNAEFQRRYADYSIVNFLGDYLLHRELNKRFCDIFIKEFLQEKQYSFIRTLLDSWWKIYGGQISSDSMESFSVQFSAINDEVRRNVVGSILKEGCREIFQFLLKASVHIEIPTSELSVDIVKILMELRPNSDANTLFLKAVKSGNLDVCKYFLSSKTIIDLNFELDAGRTLADFALETSDVGILKLLEKNEVKVRFDNLDQLHEICLKVAKFDNKDNFKWLLQRGLTIDTLLKDGNSLLHVAAAFASSNFFCWLLFQNNGKKLVNVENYMGRTPLHVAIVNNNLPAVKVLIENGANVILTDEVGFTMLHYAAMHGNEEICLQFLRHYEDVNPKTKDGKTPLLVAGQANKLAAVKALIQNGADSNSMDENGYTILHFAASVGDREMLLYILDYFDDVNSKTNRNQTPLHVAASNNNFEAVKVLIENNADVNLRDDDDYSILDYAILTENIKMCSFLLKLKFCFLTTDYRTSNDETLLLFAALKNKLKSLKFLINNGADVNAFNNDGLTILHIIAKYGNRDSCSYVLDNYNNINVQNMEGVSPLHVAVDKGNLETVKILIENKADVYLADVKGWTVWHYAACAGGNTEIWEYLFNFNSDINAQNNNGDTPLLVATMKNKIEFVKYSIEKGADVKKANNEGFTVLHEIAKHGNTDICFYLLDYFRDINVKTIRGETPLHSAISNNNFQTVKALIKSNADVRLTNGYGWTVWHYAARIRNAKIWQFLLNYNREINVKSKHGNTPVLVAAFFNNLESLSFLIEIGADVNMVDNEQWTILHYVAQNGNRDICSYVLEKYNDIDVKQKDNATPLHIAVDSGNLETVKVLIENNADVYLADKYGWTIWHYAARGGSFEICSFLLNYNKAINDINKLGYTALFVAALNNKFESITFLIDNDADVNAVDNKGYTILHKIAQYGNRHTCSYVFAYYNDINVKNMDGETPLHVAIDKSNFETVKFLVENNADFSSKTLDDKTIWHYAVQDGNSKICSYLLDSIIDITMRSEYTAYALYLSKKGGEIEQILSERMREISWCAEVAEQL